MIGSIYLIGGGELRDGETYEINEGLKSLAPVGSTFVFFGSAAHDSSEYAAAIESVFGNTFEVVVPTVKKGREYAIDAIKSASVIYLGGGDTDLLMRLFSEWNLVEHLVAALKRGVHIAGMSAGAQVLSTWYVHEDADVVEVRKGWGIVPIGVQVHTNQNSFAKAKALWANFHGAGKYSFVAIGEGVAWYIDASGEHTVGHGTIWKL
jgi:peptidase E